MIPHPDCHPINLAPRDGTVILTDQGFMRYVTRQGHWHGWVFCSPFGHEYACAEYGYFYGEPSSFGPLPDWLL